MRLPCRRLQEIKLLISKGQNPFNPMGNTLDEIFKRKIENKRLSQEWSEFTISNYELFYEKILRKPFGHKKLNKITYDDLLKILENKEFLIKKNVWKNRLAKSLETFNANPKNRRKVYQYTKDGAFIKEYESVKEATKEMGLKHSSGIYLSCNHNNCYARGFKWSFNSPSL